ncbi:MAG: nucleoside phosphorylase [Thermoanaerobaculia bacterium]|nr:nucleoside phosphorylase [Thermoanaerobaculia bacterium]
MSDTSDRLYHIGFGRSDLGDRPPTLALLSGDPSRATRIASEFLDQSTTLSENRGLHSYMGQLPGGRPVLSCTSGMGAPSLSIVVNELVQVGIRTVIRIGTCGSIQEHVGAGDVVVTSGALVRQGAAADLAPPGYPAVADPFLTVALAEAAETLDIRHHVGLTASVDTFYEGQERTDSSANPFLLRRHVGMIDEYRHLHVLNFEMEAATLLTMSQVYGFVAGCICGVVAQRTEAETVVAAGKAHAVANAIRVAVRAAEAFA